MSFSSAFDGTIEALANRRAIQQQVEDSRAKLVQSGFDPDNPTSGGTPTIIPGGAQDIQDNQNAITMANVKALQSKLAAQDSDNAVMNFATTGDATQMQRALDTNPQLKQAWGQKGVQNITNLNFSDPNDQRLLSQSGINSSAYNTPDKAAVIGKNIYKYYDQNNVPHLGMLNNVVQQTGMISRVSPQQANVLHQSHAELYSMMAGPRNSYNTAEGSPYQKQISAASAATGVPANLLASMINTESSGRANAVSPKGPAAGDGLMQVGQQALATVGMQGADMTDPAQNIMAGAKYMAYNLKRYHGNTQLALAAYNAGPTAVDQHNGIPPYPETQNYVTKTMNNWRASQVYTQGGQQAADAGNQVGAQPTVTGNPSDPNSTPNPTNNVSTIQQFSPPPDASQVEANADDTISTIQKWEEGNAMAAHGTDPQLARMKILYSTMTPQQKDNMAADNTRMALVASFGGTDAFFNTNFDPSTKVGRENFNEAMPQIEQYAKLQGTPLSAADRATIQEARGLMAYAGKAVQLQTVNTGILGQLAEPIQRYLGTNVSATQAVSAYKALNISFQHAMDGSRVTPAEIEQQHEIAGDLGEKAGPIFAQMANIFGQVKSKLDSVATLNDPYVAKVMLGSDVGKADKIQQAIQDRIDLYEGLANSSGKPPTWKPPESTDYTGKAAPTNTTEEPSLWNRLIHGPGYVNGAKGDSQYVKPKQSLDQIFKGG